MIKLLINGALGQMGRTILRLARADAANFTVLSGVDAFAPESGGEAEGYPVVNTLEKAPQDADVVIDFSRPEAISGLIAYGEKNGAKLVVCTTGLGEAELKALSHASEKIAMFQSGNMSLGVNLQTELIKKAAATLGEKFDVEIIERHHNKKVDAPSGTALMLANAVKGEYSPEKTFTFGRHSKDARRTPNEIGIHAVRGGTVVGAHEVAFYGEDEVVTVSHQAFSKQVFAAGALRAAQYIMQKETGFYNMHDLVTEQSVLTHLYTDDAQSLITVSGLPDTPGVLGKVFHAIAKVEIVVDMISQSLPQGKAADLSFSLPRAQLASAVNVLNGLRGEYPNMDVYALDHLTKITVEGPGMALRHGVAAELFSALGEAGVDIELITTSETKIALCVKNGDALAALKAIKTQFRM